MNQAMKFISLCHPHNLGENAQSLYWFGGLEFPIITWLSVERPNNMHTHAQLMRLILHKCPFTVPSKNQGEFISVQKGEFCARYWELVLLHVFFDNSLKQIIFIGYNFNASLIFLTWQASMISLSKRYCSMVDMNSVLPYLTRNFSFSFNVVAGEFPGVLRKLSSSVSEKVGECERLSPRLLNVLVTDISSPTTRRLFASDGESRRLVPP